MRKNSDSDDDAPMPKTGKGKGGLKKGGGGGGGGGGGVTIGGRFIGSESSSMKDTSPSDNSFLYTGEAPQTDRKAKSEEKTKEGKTKKKGKSATAATSGEGYSKPPRSVEHSIDDDGNTFDLTGRGNGSGDSPDLSFDKRGSLRRMGEQLGRDSSSPGVGQGPAKAGDQEESGGKHHGKISMAKLTRLLKRGKKTEEKENEEEPVVAARSDVLGTAGPPSSGYMAPRSEASFWSGNAGTAGYPVTSGHPPYRDQRTVAIPVGDEQQMCDKERLMKERQRKISHRKICESIALTVILVLLFIVGIILTAMSSLGLAFQILGPTILGLSAFALVGKVFVTVFWEEDPFLRAKSGLFKVSKRVNRNKMYASKTETAGDASGVALQSLSTTGSVYHHPPSTAVHSDRGDFESPAMSAQSSFIQHDP